MGPKCLVCLAGAIVDVVLKERARECGVSLDVSLSWRSRPSGEAAPGRSVCLSVCLELGARDKVHSSSLSIVCVH